MATETLPQIFTPRKNAPVRYANYDGHEGYATVTGDWTVLFRTAGSLWYPVLNQVELVILGLVGEAEAQLGHVDELLYANPCANEMNKSKKGSPLCTRYFGPTLEAVFHLFSLR
jgi:hypothetical protein